MPAGLSELLEELSERPEVLGVALFGSAARGDARTDSDVDVYVLVKDGSWRDIETRDGKHYEFVYASASESEAFWKANPHDYVKLWTDARILFDPEGQLAAFRKDAERFREQGPPQPDPKAIAHGRFDADDQLRAIRALQHSDPATAALALHRLIERLSEVFFSLRGRWVPPPKERLNQIRELAPKLGRAFDTIYVAEAIGTKVEAAQDLVDCIFDNGIQSSSHSEQLSERRRKV